MKDRDHSKKFTFIFIFVMSVCQSVDESLFKNEAASATLKPRTIVKSQFQVTLNESVAALQDEPYLRCKNEGGWVVSQYFCLPSSYRKDVPPPTKNGPLIVTFKLPVSEVSEIDDHKSIITIRLGYKLKWPESRMIINKSADWTKGEINISPDYIKHFWTPDIIIHDLVKFNKPEILNDVGAMEIFQDGRVYYKVRSDITVVCKAMEFGHYPLDNHKCYFLLTSFGYDLRKMILRGRFSYRPEDQRTLSFNVNISHLPPDKTIYNGSSSDYSAYGFEIQLSRYLGPFLLSVYLPSAMFVMMSWVSFLIPADVVPARIVLLVTLCLVLINMFNSTTTRIPVSNAVTAMEVWLLVCMLLVFLSLVEYAIILRYMVVHRRKLEANKRKIEKYTNGKVTEIHPQPSLAQLLHPGEPNGIVTTSLIESPHKPGDKKPKTFIKKKWKKKSSCPKKIDQKEGEARVNAFKTNLDRAATYLFPIMFGVFNAVYWTLYLTVVKAPISQSNSTKD